jgi:hypothetical protein
MVYTLFLRPVNPGADPIVPLTGPGNNFHSRNNSADQVDFYPRAGAITGKAIRLPLFFRFLQNRSGTKRLEYCTKITVDFSFSCIKPVRLANKSKIINNNTKESSLSYTELV